MAIWQFPKWFRRFLYLLFFVLSTALFLLLISVHDLFLNTNTKQNDLYYPNRGLINTANLNFFLSSSKTQVQQFKKDVSNSATPDSIMNAHKKTQHTHARINCALKDLSCDSPLPKNLKLIILSSSASSSSTKLTQDQKDLFKACNGDECKGKPQIMRIMGNGSRKVTISSSFFQEKAKAQRVFKWSSHTYKVGHKKREGGNDGSCLNSHSICWEISAWCINLDLGINARSHLRRSSSTRSCHRSGGSSEVSRSSTSSRSSSTEVKSIDFRYWEVIEVPRACKVGEVEAQIPEGLEAGAGKDASTSIESTSTSGKVSIGAALLLSASS
ncbi:hypothetical protein H5410_046063 [Solanum commersonii]|uniref:Uncharacterized protein n=1 Tax=Solanum commersonii TaxID=4109 RepID=A0A9J5XDC2_SOLCO|nr:hypothetical protein H5410_046063 [Solanum commersonii]